MVTVTAGGQISLPAPIRARWKAKRVMIEDHGDSIVAYPVPDDPIQAAVDLVSPYFKSGPSVDEIRAQMREEEIEAEERKWGREP